MKQLGALISQSPCLRVSDLRNRFGHDDRGGIMVMFALMLPVLFGIVGLGFESGMWFKERRELQTIADAAVVSAAIENSYGEGSTVVTAAATLEATNNGFDATTDSITYVGTPTSGTYSGNTDYIEIIITRQLTTVLSQIFQSFSPSSTARAVATTGTLSTGEACVLALDTSGAAVSVGGNGSVTFDGCQVASNSADANSLSVSGSGGLNVDCYSVVGAVSATAGLTTAADCSPSTGAAALDDPYTDLTDPDDGVCDEGGITHNSTTTITRTGTEAAPWVICGDVWVKKGTLILNGLIVIKGGDFKANAQGTVESDTTNGSTIVLKADAGVGGNLGTINGSATLNLKAPPAGFGGAWEGILFYQDRDTVASCSSNCGNKLNGSSSTTFEGVVYFPNQQLEFLGGNSSDYSCLQLVAGSISFSGNSNMLADNDCTAAGVDPISIPTSYYAKLVE